MNCTDEGRQILQLVQDEILTSPEKWTQVVYARDKEGSSTGPVLGNAVSFCLLGACRKASWLISERTKEYVPPYRGESCLRSVLGSPGIVQFNDDPKTTFEDVRALLARALSPEGSESGGSQETEGSEATT